MSTILINSRKYSEELCRILGEDPRKVAEIKLIMEATSGMKAIITRFISSDECEQLLNLGKQGDRE